MHLVRFNATRLKAELKTYLMQDLFCNDIWSYYHRDSRQEFAKVGGIFPILHVVVLLDACN